MGLCIPVVEYQIRMSYYNREWNKGINDLNHIILVLLISRILFRNNDIIDNDFFSSDIGSDNSNL